MNQEIARLTKEPKTPMGKLLRMSEKKKLLRTRDRLFYILVTTHVSLLAACLFVLLQKPPLWAMCMLALPAAFLSTQIAFHVHDILHGQAPRKGRNKARGVLPKLLSVVLGNVLVGLSGEWWKPKHDDHHKNPNHLEKDPDIRSIFFAIDEKQLRNRKGLSLFFVRHQHKLLQVLALFQAYSFRLASIRYILAAKWGWSSFFGAAGLAAHYALYGWLIIHLGANGIIFAMLHQAFFGLYNTNVFAPNHKGMPIIEPGTRLDFFRMQVRTARNIRGGWFVSYVTGGLDLQIEHHLLPGVPRYNLRGIQPLVEEVCREIGETYTEVSPLESVHEWMGTLKRVSKSA